MPVEVSVTDREGNVTRRTVNYKINAPTVRFPGDPGSKMLYGAAVEGGKPEPFEAQLGRKISVFRSYFQSGDTATQIAGRAAADHTANRMPLMSLKLPMPWTAFAAGEGDAWFIAILRALNGLARPSWLALHHEPRGDGLASDWVAMQKRARTLINTHAPSTVALIGILNGYSFTYQGGAEAPGYNHPVGSGVHVMGFDSYNPWYSGGSLAWKSVSEVFAPATTIAKWGYPTLCAEYGVRAAPAAAQWMTDAAKYCSDAKFVALSYFNSGANSPNGPWTLEGPRLEAYKKALNLYNP
jgi:hypothetical protein